MNLWRQLHLHQQVTGSSFKHTRVTLSFLCQVILLILVIRVGLNLVDAKGGGGRGGGFGRSGGSGFGRGWGGSKSSSWNGGMWRSRWFGSSSYTSRGNGYYYGGGGCNWGLFGGLAFWTMAGTPRRYRYASDCVNCDSAGPESVDWLLLLSGIGFLASWLFSFIIRVTFTGTQYHQDNYVAIQFVAYAAYLVFISVAGNIPIDGDTSEDDAWSRWFDRSTPFVKLGRNPLSGFDAYSAVIGVILSGVILMRYLGFCRGEHAPPEDILPKHFPTSCRIGFYVIVGLLTFVSMWSWSLVMIVASAITVFGLMARYIGIVVSRLGVLDKGKDPVEVNEGVFRLRAMNGYEIVSKCFWHDGLDLLGGLFSVIFHVRMPILLGDWGIFFVNFAPFCIGTLALIFNPILIILISLNYSRQRKSVVEGANCRGLVENGVYNCYLTTIRSTAV